MKLIQGIFILMFGVFMTIQAKADSPLTSTDFYKAYPNNDYIKLVLQSGDEMTEEVFQVLEDKSISYDIKAAMINAYGWETKANRAQVYLDFLSQKTKIKNEKDLIKKGTAEQIMNYSYLYAMENYMDVQPVLLLVDKAIQKKSTSFALNIVGGLIMAQNQMDSDWCGIYKIGQSIREAKQLKQDMNKEAQGIIFSYLQLYQPECNK